MSSQSETSNVISFIYIEGLKVPKDVTSVEIDSSVTRIEKNAFQDCWDLVEINIPEGVTSIEDEAFLNCCNLEKIIFPSTLISIENGAFCQCSSLISVTLPPTLTKIGEEAFSECSCIKSITLPSSLTIIGEGAFFECSSLISLALPYNLAFIYEETFYGCSSLTNIVLPSNLAEIHNGAFYKCTSLINIALPSNLIEIGDAAFSDCTNLASIALPYNLSKIGKEAFSNCTSLKNINLPSNLTTIGEAAFANCSNLADIILPPSLGKIGQGAFCHCSNLTNVSVPQGITEIKDEVFSQCCNITKIILPSSITKIGDEAFSECTSLMSVTLPPALISIGEVAFYKCSNLVVVSLPPNLTSIGDEAFFGCEKLLLMNAPNRNIEIGANCFYGCDLILNEREFDNDEFKSWLENRFENLPLHSLCSNPNLSIDELKDCIDRYPNCSEQKDEFGFTPLHILAANSSITKDSFKIVMEAYPAALTTKCILGMLPQHILLYNTNVSTDLFIPEVVKAKTLDDKYANSIMRDDQHSLTSLAIVLFTSSELQLFLYSHHPVDRGKFSGMKSKLTEQIKYIEKKYLDDLLKSRASVEGWSFLIQHGWVQFLIILSDEQVVNDICTFIKSTSCSNALAKSLAYARDHEYRMALHIAHEKIRDALEKKIFFLGRYDIVKGPHLHKSSTCIIKKAIDVKSREYYAEIFHKFAKDESYIIKKQLKDALIYIGAEINERRLGEIIRAWDKHADEQINEEEFKEICKEYIDQGRNRQVALKFMKFKDQFIREHGVRSHLHGDSNYFVQISEFRSDLDRHVPIIVSADDFRPYKFLLVMTFADRNLEEIIYNERPDSEKIRSYAEDLAMSLDQLHDDGFIHGDLKPSNIVRCGGKLRLIDFDASSEIDLSKDRDHSQESRFYAGKRFSSSSLPPEMIFNCTSKNYFKSYFHGNNEKKNGGKYNSSQYWRETRPHQSEKTSACYTVKTFLTKDVEKKDTAGNIGLVEVVRDDLPYKPVKSSPSIDLWALGTILFSMSTGYSILDLDASGDLKDGKAMEELYYWNEEQKDKKLKSVDDPRMKSLLGVLLSSNPDKRGSIKELLKHHPFFQSDDISSEEEKSVDSNVDEKVADKVDGMPKVILEAIEINSPKFIIILPFKLSKDKKTDDYDKVKNYVGTVLLPLQKLYSAVNITKEIMENKCFDQPCYIYLIDEYQRTIACPKGPYPIEIDKRSEAFESILIIMSTVLASLRVLDSAKELTSFFFSTSTMKKGYFDMFEKLIATDPLPKTLQESEEIVVDRSNEMGKFVAKLYKHDKGFNYSGLTKVCNWLNGNIMWVSESSLKEVRKENRFEIDLADTKQRKYIAKLVAENERNKKRTSKLIMKNERNEKRIAELVAENANNQNRSVGVLVAENANNQNQSLGFNLEEKETKNLSDIDDTDCDDDLSSRKETSHVSLFCRRNHTFDREDEDSDDDSTSSEQSSLPSWLCRTKRNRNNHDKKSAKNTWLCHKSSDLRTASS